MTGALVRPLRLDEVGVRIDYFHDATDEYLLKLGVDRALLPDRDAWRSSYAEDFSRPLPERDTYNLAWELDGRLIGFRTRGFRGEDAKGSSRRRRGRHTFRPLRDPGPERVRS